VHKPDLEFVSLKKRRDFVDIAKRGSFAASRSVVIQCKDVESEDGNINYGITVSKKVSKRAVVRNRIKRQIRVIIRAVDPDLYDPNKYYVVIGRVAAIEKSFKDMLRDYKYCLKRLRAEAEKLDVGSKN
jgi:ribonuclease P protein component